MCAPSGSGKSYLAKMLRDLEVESGGDAPRIYSMDDYFMTEVEKVCDWFQALLIFVLLWSSNFPLVSLCFTDICVFLLLLFVSLRHY